MHAGGHPAQQPGAGPPRQPPGPPPMQAPGMPHFQQHMHPPGPPGSPAVGQQPPIGQAPSNTQSASAAPSQQGALEGVGQFYGAQGTVGQVAISRDPSLERTTSSSSSAHRTRFFLLLAVGTFSTKELGSITSEWQLACLSSCGLCPDNGLFVKFHSLLHSVILVLQTGLLRRPAPHPRSCSGSGGRHISPSPSSGRHPCLRPNHSSRHHRPPMGPRKPLRPLQRSCPHCCVHVWPCGGFCLRCRHLPLAMIALAGSKHVQA